MLRLASQELKRPMLEPAMDSGVGVHSRAADISTVVV
jgi:hypothetical protein